MKTALLLTGQLGLFDYKKYNHKERWLSAINSNDIDVFCVAEDNNYYSSKLDAQVFSSENKEQKVKHDNPSFKYKNTVNLSYEESKDEILHILNFNNVKNILIYLDKEINNEGFLSKNEYHKTFMLDKSCNREYSYKIRLLSQFFKLQKAFQLMEKYENENGIRYEAVIRSRFDLSLNSGFFVESFSLLDNALYAPYDYACRHMNDWLAIGGKNIMQLYCNYYDYFALPLKHNHNHFIYNNSGTWQYLENTQDPGSCQIGNIADSCEVGLTFLMLNNGCTINPYYNFILRRDY